MSRVCNKCGHPVVPETEIKEYPFYCPHCNENMYEFETHEVEMKQGCKIVIQDGDNYGEVLGIVTIEDNTCEDFYKEIDSYRKEKEGCWSWDNFIDYLKNKNWKFTWESENVWSLSI